MKITIVSYVLVGIQWLSTMIQRLKLETFKKNYYFDFRKPRTEPIAAPSDAGK